MSPILDRRQMLTGGAAIAGLSLGSTTVFAQSDRIESLIAKMTPAEKAGQLSCFSDQIRPIGVPFNPGLATGGAAEQLARIKTGQIGMLFNGVGYAGAKAAQDAALATRLKIPLIFAGDVIHGLRTAYPLPIAEACAFDPDLAMRTARAAALETTALGIHWTFAPMVDVARDQRWGRVAEGSGEDPYLGMELAKARVRGFQGNDLRDPTRVAACAKHFAAYGAVSGGQDYNFTEISSATLHEVHLAPFRAAVDAGVATLMSAFNDIDGVPSSGNHWLMTDLLRGEWRFRGMVVGDYTADEELIAHGYATDGRDAAKKAFMAGMDMAMQSNLFNLWLPDLVEKGEVPLARLDEGVRRVLHLKDAIGLFDNAYRSVSQKAERTSVSTPAMLKLSREAGARSIVLLKNDGNLLPLKKNPGRIALIGPFAEDRKNVVGTWAFMADEKLNVSIAQGLRTRGLTVTTAPGSEIEAPLPGGIAAAVAAAQNADIVLLAVGESQLMSGEAQSRTEITIPAPQIALAEAIAATGKPMIVLLRHGRALALHGAVKAAPAILATWFLGSESGNAIADVLFGDVNPSAKLSASFPNESGQEPYFYNHKNTGRPAPDTGSQEYKSRYRETKNEALYPFGHGLSYTSFSVSNVVAPARMTNALTVTATVTNTGARAGDEVVQLYIHDRVASRTRPVRELKGFARVSLAPGASKRVTLTLKREDLRFWGDGDWVIEPGLFDLWVATSSVDGEKQSFELV
ncbi:MULTISPECIES: glycoside hydrolase family 3 N-terminal domain-containing protein [unclassified Sphingomonas]|uniref:glycoside hydrolase family 3 N-terminal domain-containing protein n=1 Tax=unclassified Sphingomonas TaxID=196159 RepID=UPI000E74E1C5|nr:MULTISPECIES: glycoside hydrolase family 3 N-terminal domain-containing protein [unclassified Sphingomonas]RKE50272.1 beta-glucosidase [Sphingomonas sp. PP-CC-1A-547]TCM08607.1 beta-glucosidase [Sphingomonas sp. PP-CC-3G-468]